MTAAYLLLVAGYLAAAAALITLILIVDLGDRQVEAEAAEFRRRLATIPDLEPRPGTETGAAPPSRPGGCAGLGVRAIRPRTVAGPVRVDCPI